MQKPSSCGVYCVPPRRRHQLQTNQLAVGSVSVAPVDSVRDFGVLLNSDMSMDAHLTRLVSSCFGVLRQIRCIRRSLPREALSTLVTSFITSKIDNYNVALAGLPQRDLDRIQSVLNATARLTADARKFDHVTPLLVNLHWLRVPGRIQYKLCVLVHRCLNGAAPQYLFELIQPLSDVDSRRRQRSVSTAEVLVPATLNHWRPCSCRRWSTYLEKSCSRSTPVPDIFHFRNTPEVTSV